jgi:hypothetical protein
LCASSTVGQRSPRATDRVLAEPVNGALGSTSGECWWTTPPDGLTERQEYRLADLTDERTAAMPEKADLPLSPSIARIYG